MSNVEYPFQKIQKIVFYCVLIQFTVQCHTGPRTVFTSNEQASVNAKLHYAIENDIVYNENKTKCMCRRAELP